MTPIARSWFEVRAGGAVACAHTSHDVVDAIAARLESAGLRTIVGSSPVHVVSYRDAPPQMRSLAQVGKEPLLAERVRELRIWAAGPGVIRYEAAFRPDVFEAFLVLFVAVFPLTLLNGISLVLGAGATLVLVMALVRMAVAKNRRELCALVERAVREAPHVTSNRPHR